MAMQIDMLSKNLLHSQTHIWNHIFSFIKSMSLKCAIQLQIPDIIDRHGSSMLLSELVEALAIKPERAQFVYRLMRILVHTGFFVKQRVSSTRRYEEEEGEGYSLAPPSRLLLKEDPLSIRPFLLAMLDPKLIDPWQNMSEWFHTDDATAFHTTHGGSLWDLAGQEPRLNRLFNDAMASDARLVMSVMLKQGMHVFQGLDSIVDVGGGTGTVAKAIVEAFPAISCICFDLPHVVNGLVGSENLTYVGGDMFETVPNANAVLLKAISNAFEVCPPEMMWRSSINAHLKVVEDPSARAKKWILHDWCDADCIKILKNCKGAIPSKQNGGKLVIIDMVVKADKGDNELFESQLFFDMIMMTCLSGRERTEKDWAKLFLDGGFNDYKITPILGSRSLIEVYP